MKHHISNEYQTIINDLKSNNQINIENTNDMCNNVAKLRDIALLVEYGKKKLPEVNGDVYKIMMYINNTYKYDNFIYPYISKLNKIYVYNLEDLYRRDVPYISLAKLCNY